MDLELLVHQLGNWSEGSGRLYVRLARALEKIIQHGILLPGTRLPAERTLAEALALSRTTVVTAYNTLRTEGWLESRTGSGTWVSGEKVLRERRQGVQPPSGGSSLMNLLSIDDSETVDFAVATPRPLASLPREHLTVSPQVQDALLNERNYMPLGLPALRDAIARYYQRMGLPTEANQILVTAGAQQAISIVIGLYLRRGDTVLAENPTYFGALEAFRMAGARVAAMPVEAGHLDPRLLRDRILANGPRLVYLTPTHHNPTGALMPESARREVARIAEEFGVPVIEDGTLADMIIDRVPPPPIAAFPTGGTIISIGSLSKLCWAGLRIGWLRAPVSITGQLARVKSTADLGSPLITQVIASQLVEVAEQAKTVRREQLSTRRDVLVRLLQEYIPEWTFRVPNGGLFLWVKLPGYDASRFAQFAARYGVALTPGAIFTSDGGFNEYLRIPFLLDEPAIETGVLRLKNAWESFRNTASIEPVQAPTIV
jgi:DNA-binding transcriptional MocR family regulator